GTPPPAVTAPARNHELGARGGLVDRVLQTAARRGRVRAIARITPRAGEEYAGRLGETSRHDDDNEKQRHCDRPANHASVHTLSFLLRERLLRTCLTAGQPCS